MRVRTVMALGALSALTAISIVVHFITLGVASACPTEELGQLRAATHTLRDQLRAARLALSSERARAQQQQQQQEQQDLRHQEQQLQRELHQLKQQHQVLLPDVDLATATVAAPSGQEAAGAPSAAVPPELVAARRAVGRHPMFRLAMVVPWLGGSFPSWMEHFLASCAQSDYLVDWLVFHQDAEVPPHAPRNVRFVNLGPHGLGVQFGITIAAATNQTHRTHELVQLFQQAFQHFAYIVTEYKPTLGTVFAQYLQDYSHWSYTDIDLMVPAYLPGLPTRATHQGY